MYRTYVVSSSSRKSNRHNYKKCYLFFDIFRSKRMKFWKSTTSIRKCNVCGENPTHRRSSITKSWKALTIEGLVENGVCLVCNAPTANNNSIHTNVAPCSIAASNLVEEGEVATSTENISNGDNTSTENKSKDSSSEQVQHVFHVDSREMLKMIQYEIINSEDTSFSIQKQEFQVKQLFNEIESHFEDFNLQKILAKVLWALLSQSDINRQAIYEWHGIVRILTIIERILAANEEHACFESHQTEKLILCYLGALRCFLQFTSSSSNSFASQVFRDHHRYLQISLDAIAKFSKNQDIHEYSCNILVMTLPYITEKQLCTKITIAVIEALREASTLPSAVEFYKSATRLLANMCKECTVIQGDEFCGFIIHRIISDLLPLTKSIKDEIVQDYMTFLLASMSPHLSVECCNIPSRSSCEVSNDIIVYTIQVIRMYPYNGILQSNAFSVIAHLSASNSNGVKSACQSSSGAISAISRALLHNNEIRRSGAISAISRVLLHNDEIIYSSSSSEKTQIQMDSFFILLALSVDSDENKAYILSHGVVESFVVPLLRDLEDSIWEHNAESLYLANFACRLLESLGVAPDGKDNILWILESGALAAIASIATAAVMSFDENLSPPRQELCNIYCYMCRFSVILCVGGADVRPDVITVIITAMGLEIFNTDQDILNLSANTIAALFESRGSCTTEINDDRLCTLVETIVRLMKNGPSPLVQSSCCEALSAITLSSDAAAQTVEAKGMDQVRLTVRQHVNDESVIEQAIFVTQQVINAGRRDVITILVQLLESHPRVMRLQEEGCRALWIVAISNKDALAIVKTCGGMEVCINAVHRFSDSSSLLLSTTALCEAYFEGQTIFKGTLSRKILAALFVVLKSEQADQCVQEAAIKLVTNYGQSSFSQLANTDQVFFDNAMETILNLMLLNLARPDSISIQRNASIIFSRMSSDKDLRRTCASAEVFRIIFLVIQRHQACSDTITSSLVSILNFCEGSDHSKILIGEKSPDISTVMRVHIDNQYIQEISCKLLRSLALYEENQVIIQTANGVDGLVNAILAHISCLTVVEEALAAFLVLSANTELSVLKSNKIGYEVILQALWVHYQVPGVVTTAFHILANFSSHDPRSLENRDLDPVVYMMIYHRQDSKLQDAACRVLYNCACFPNNLKLLGANERILQLLLELPSSDLVTSECKNRATRILDLIYSQLPNR